MVSDKLGKQLHDLATRGKALSAEEQVQLEAWYAAQDRAEMDELGLAAATEIEASLQAQVDSALAQLGAATKRIQEIAQENRGLRHEIAVLRRQLAQRALSEPA
jgi:peptidoglycan hydrolase CwlO-like protein